MIFHPINSVYKFEGLGTVTSTVELHFENSGKMHELFLDHCNITARYSSLKNIVADPFELMEAKIMELSTKFFLHDKFRDSERKKDNF